MKTKPLVVIKGSVNSGYVITVSGRDGFSDDIALVHEEVLALKKLLDKFK